MQKKLPFTPTLICMSKIAVVAILLLSSFFASAQTKKNVKWAEMAKNRNATFYDVKKDFESKWKGKLKEMARENARARLKPAGQPKKEEKEAAGYEIYKRWESYMAPRVYPSGDMTLPSTNYQNFTTWQKSVLTNPANIAPANIAPGTTVSGNWTSIGPTSTYSKAISGVGRVNFVRFLPGNSNTMFLGTPNGGLWKSTDAGATWTTNTDFLPVIGCSDLAIDPTNTNNMYLSTGDIEGDRSSIGVLKSTDGGATWNATAMTFQVAQGYTISKLLMNPANPLNQLISTSNGVYRTTDGWATFTQTECCDVFKDMKFKPGDPNTVYVAGTTFSRSTNNGVTWTPVTTGLPTSNVSRIALGVTAGNSGYVYALIGDATNQAFLGLYRSTDSGVSFTKRSSSPNLLGYNADGSDLTSGQAFYDLSIAVSPTNAEQVTTGGVNHWQSADGGVTWTNKTVWDSGVIHADIHEIDYLPGSSTTMFSCNDGGIYESIDNATTWTDISHNLSIAQVVGIGLSGSVATTMVDGEQDNATNLKTGPTWKMILGGDGGQCFIDYTSNNTIYAQYVQGDFNRSDDGGVTMNEILTGLPATGAAGVFDFYSSWHQDPVTPAKLYVAGTPTLYGSVNQGTNWTALGTPPGTGSITEFTIAPSNPAIIYAVKQDAVSKSTNSGASFTDITGTLPANAAFSNVTVSNTDPNKVWVTYSGYSAPDKVYKSVDGGSTWTAMSTGLPNLPMNTIIHVNGSSTDALYLGADIGVYYFDNTLSSWIPFMTSLPKNTVKDLKIYYPTGKIRAATYGRGVWESDLYGASVLSTDATLANFTMSSGTLTPVFAKTTTSYSVSVANSVTSVLVRPTATNATATIKVNGTTVASGAVSGSIPLSVGANSINAVVTAQDGVTTKTYTITVTRAASLTTLATLSNLTISSGTLSPAFATAITSYAVSVANNVTYVLVRPTATDAAAAIKVNGTTTASGTVSGSIPLNFGANMINVVVTAEDGVTTKTYTITVTRAAPIYTVAALSNLTISNGTLSPAFATATTSYAVSVTNSVTSVLVRPTATDAAATIIVNGTTVVSGTVSGSIPLVVGKNTINAVVTAEDGVTTKTYTLTVTRTPSTIATLSNFTISSGTLSPAFATATTSYSVSVANSITSVLVRPTASSATATIKVNGTTVASGTVSGSIMLTVGTNTINAVVTAQDGVTTKTYTITVTRAISGINSLFFPGHSEPTTLVSLLNEKVEANNILSPNGDGINDIWVVKNIAFYPNNSVTVYNKAGEVIFAKKGYTNDWDGTYRGAVLSEGTYYYLVDLGNGATVKGFLTVLRAR